MYCESAKHLRGARVYRCLNKKTFYVEIDRIDHITQQAEILKLKEL